MYITDDLDIALSVSVPPTPLLCLMRARALKLYPKVKLPVCIPSNVNASSQQLFVRSLLAEG